MANSAQNYVAVMHSADNERTDENTPKKTVLQELIAVWEIKTLDLRRRYGRRVRCLRINPGDSRKSAPVSPMLDFHVQLSEGV